MPPVIAFIAKGITFITTMGAAGSGLAALVVGTTAIVAASRLLKPKINFSVDDNDRSRQTTVRSTTEPRKLVYGETMVSGPLTYAQVSGANNKYLHQVVALAGHELTQISKVFLDDKSIDLTNSAIYDPTQQSEPFSVRSGFFGPKDNEAGSSETIVYIDTRLGTASQTAYTGLRSDSVTSQEYLSTHRGDNVASLYTRWTINEGSREVWDEVGNVQNIKALVKGKKIYDPRLEVAANSDDPAYAGNSPTSPSYVVYDNDTLSTASIDRGEQGRNPALMIADYLMDDEFGLGIPSSKIDWAAIIAAADDCDTLVPIPSSATQKRFFGSGVIFGADPYAKSIEKILSGMNGSLVYSQGKYIVRAGVYVAPTESITEDDIIGEVDIRTAIPRSDRLNQIKGLFIDPTEQYKMMEFGPVTVSGAISRDNGEVLEEEIKLPFTDNRYAAQRIAFKQVNQSFLQTMITVPVNLKGMRIAVGDRVNVYLSDLESVDSGNWNPKIFKCINWSFAENGSGGINLTLLEEGEFSNNIPIRYADPSATGGPNNSGDYSTITAQGVIARNLPDVPAPTNFSITAAINSIELNWDNPSNALAWEQIWVYRSTSSTTPTDSATPIVKFRGTSYTDQRAADGTQYYYWIQAVRYPQGSTPASGSNASKSVMVASSPVKIAATKIGNAVMGANSVDTTQIADEAVGSDQINTTIQSDNWSTSSGADGWQINRDGTATFQTAVIKGGITATSGTIGGTTITSTNLNQYSGSGAASHGNADTDFWLDSSGNFSLKDKFIWTGGTTNTLVIDGSGTFSGAVNASAGNFSGQIAVGSTAGTITVIDGNDTDYRMFTNATLDTETSQYLPDDSSFKVGNDGRVFASNITIYNTDGDVLLSPSGLGAAALNDISTTSGSVVSTVGGTVSNSTSEITITTSSASESFSITSKVALNDNYDGTQYFSGASTSSTANAEAQLTGVDVLVDYYVKPDGGSYSGTPSATQRVTIVNSGTPSSTQMRVGGFDRGSSYSGSLTRYFAVLQDFGGALEIIPNSGGGATSYVVTTAALGASLFPTAQTYKIKIVVRVVEDGTTTVISGSTTPPSSNNTTTGIYFDGGNSDERHYEITGSGLIKSSDNVFTSGGQNLLSSGGTISGNLVVTGDLTVQGTTTTVDTDNLTVKDNNITLNYSTGDSSSTANNAGITIQDAVDATTDASILWKTASDSFEFSHPVKDLSLTGDLISDSSIYLRSAGGVAGVYLQDTSGGSASTAFRLYSDVDSTTVNIDTGGSQTIAAFVNNGNLLITGTIFADGAASNSLQWETGYDYSQIGHLPLAGGTLSGNLTISRTSPVFVINDSDATTPTNQSGYISFQRQGAETAWIGYGSTGNDNFTIRNSEGLVTIEGGAEVTGGSFSLINNLAYFINNSTGHQYVYIDSGESTADAEDREAGIIWRKGGTNYWETYVPASSSDYNFYSYKGVRSVLTLYESGNVAIPNGGLSIGGELDLPSAGKIDWSSGDAYIQEGVSDNYALDFHTYDGSATSMVMSLKGDNTALFKGKIAGESVVTSGGKKLAHGILDLSFSTTPTQIKITTGIPYPLSGADFTVTIKGFAYGLSRSVDLKIHWHNYQNQFYNANISNAGSWTPTVKLAVENSKVVIHLSPVFYWGKMYVESMYSSNYADLYQTGWSWADSAISSDSNTPTKTLDYYSRTGGELIIDGTTTASENVTVNADLTLGNGNNNGVLNLKTYDDASNNWVIVNWTDDSLRMNYNGLGADEFTLTNTGQLTTTGGLVSNALTINGSALIDGQLTWGENYPNAYAYSNTDSQGLFLEVVDNNTDKAAIRFQTRVNNTGSYTSFKIDADNTKFVFSGGNVIIKNGTAPTLRIENTDTSLIADQTIGDIDFYQNDPSGSGVGVVSKIRSINSSSFQGEAGLAFHTGTASGLEEAMRISPSGQVAIGQETHTGANVKLDLHNSGDGVGTQIGFYNDHNTDGHFIGLAGNTTGNIIYYNVANTNQEFYNNNSLKMTLDASGTLGIGVVPETWLSSYTALQIGASGALASISSGNENVALSSNAYLATDGNFKYIATNEATRYLQSAGVHYWYSAASGTADNNITFSQNMTLDASGNLGLGVSPLSYAKLHIASSGTTAFYADGSRTSDGDIFDFVVRNGTDSVTSIKTIRDGANDQGTLTFSTQVTGGGIVERMRINSGAIRAENAYFYANNVASDKKWRMSRTGGNTISIEHDTAGFYFYNETEAKYLFRVHNNGNMNIGGDISARGHQIPDSGGGYYGDYGYLNFYANANFSSSARQYALTNAYDVNKFAIIYGDSHSRQPSLTTTGTLASGTSLAMSISNSGVTHLQQLGVGLDQSQWDTNSLALDVASQVSFRSFIYSGITTSGIGSWSTRQYANGSTHEIHAQALVVDNTGYVASPVKRLRAYDRGITTTGAVGAVTNTAPNAAMKCAHFATTSGTGSIVIQLPGNRSNGWSMPVIRVTTYEYSSDAANVYYISGHNWTSGWYNNSVHHHGNHPEPVYLLGNSTTNKSAIFIGAGSTSRAYLHVTVDLMSHPSFYDSTFDAMGAWTISLMTSSSGWSGSGNLTETMLHSNVGTTGDYSVASLVSSGNVTAYSDRKLKEDVEPLVGALQSVMSLQGVQYVRKDTGEKDIGFIAQQVEEDCPEIAERVVKVANKDEDIKGINYQNMVALLAEAIKDQQKQIETLTKTIEVLKNGDPKN